MRRVCLSTILLLFAFHILTITSSARAEGPRDLKSLLPENTQVVVEVRDMAALMKKWDASPAARFYGDPRAASFFRNLRGQIEDFQRRMAVDPGRLWHFFNGQFVLAGVARGSKQELEWVVLARHSGDAAVLGRLQRPPAPAGATLRRIPDTYKGLNITRLEITREVAAEIPAPKEKKKRSHKSALPTLTAEDLGQKSAGPEPLTLNKQEVQEYEEYFGPSLMVYAGTHGQPLHRILDRLAAPESGAPLAGKPEYAQVARAAGGEGDVMIYAGSGMLGAGGKGSGLVNLGALGLDEIRGAAACLSLKGDRLSVAAALLAPPPRMGISRALFLPAGSAPDAAALVPREAQNYSAVAIDLPKLWGVAMGTLQTVSPAAFALVSSQFEGFAQRTGVKVEDGLAGRLGGEVAHFTLPGTDEDGAAAETWLVALRQGGAFREALKALLDYSSMLGNYHIETGKSGQWPVWTLVEGGRGTAGAASGRPIYSVCVTDSWLLAGSRLGELEAVLGRLEKSGGGAGSLKEQRAYQSVAGALPADRFATFMLNRGGLYNVAEALLGSMELTGGRAKQGKPSAGGDFSLGLSAGRIPEEKVWDEYFGPAALALTRQGDSVVRLDGFFRFQ